MTIVEDVQSAALTADCTLCGDNLAEDCGGVWTFVIQSDGGAFWICGSCEMDAEAAMSIEAASGMDA